MWIDDLKIATAVRSLPSPPVPDQRDMLWLREGEEVFGELVSSDRRSLAFLDRRHRRLGAAEPRPEWREAMAWRWWLRHGRVGASDPLTELLRGVARGRQRGPEERVSYERVAGGADDLQTHGARSGEGDHVHPRVRHQRSAGLVGAG